MATASHAAQLTVAIGANESVSSYLLPPHLAVLRRRWDESFVMSDAAGSYHVVLRRLFEQGGFGPPRTIAVGSVEGVKRAVAQDGNGIGVLPRFTVEEELGRGVLAEITPEPRLPDIVLKAQRRPGPPSPPAEELIERLRD